MGWTSRRNACHGSKRRRARLGGLDQASEMAVMIPKLAAKKAQKG
jgi:hypothetical protein